MRRKKLWWLIGLGFFLSCSIFGIGYKVDSLLVRKHQNFIFCNLIKKGMTQEKVKETLLLIGSFQETDYTPDQDTLERKLYRFSDPLLSHLTGDYVIIGYKDNQLVVRYKITSLSDYYYLCQ